MANQKHKYHCHTCGITLTTDSEAKVICFVCTVPLKQIIEETK